MVSKYIDTHAHVNFKAFEQDAEEVIRRALEAGVWVVNVGSQGSTSQKAVEMAHEYEEGVYACVGLHPIHTDKSYQDEEELGASPAGGFNSGGEDFDHNFYFDLAKDPKTVAIGEVGLDYHHFKEGDDLEELKKKQKEILLEFIQLANEVGKPVMLHCWDAHNDLLDILRDNPVEKRGILHSFNGGFRTARKFIELGYYIGLNGMMTYTPDFNRLIKELPLEWIVSETDAPYLMPRAQGEPACAGRRNEPLHVREVVRHIAEVKGLSLDQVKGALLLNGKRIFGLV